MRLEYSVSRLDSRVPAGKDGDGMYSVMLLLFWFCSALKRRTPSIAVVSRIVCRRDGTEVLGARTRNNKGSVHGVEPKKEKKAAVMW